MRDLGRSLFAVTLIGSALLITTSTGWPQTKSTISLQQPAPPETRIVANKKNPVQLGELIEFRLQPEGLVAKSHFTFEVDYGDGTRETIPRNLQFVQHRYKSAKQFQVSVNVLPLAGVPTFGEALDSTMVEVVRMRLSVTPSRTEVGVPVLLKAASVSTDSNLRYRFSYGDGSQSDWLDRDEMGHVYSDAGDYTATAEIASADTLNTLDSVSSEVITVKAVAPSSVRLIASPEQVEANESVKLAARFDAKGRHVQYRFVYGDDTESDWQDDPQQTHSYEGKANAETYFPYVKVGFLMDGQLYPLVDSDKKSIRVAAVQIVPTPTTPTPIPPIVNPTSSPDWVKILVLIVVGLLIFGTLIALTRTAVKNWFPKPKPTFVAHADIGTASMSQTPAARLIAFQVQVDPNLRGGFHQLISRRPFLIRDQRRES